MMARGLGELSHVLQHVDDGMVGEELNAAILGLAQKVAERGGKGKISLVLQFERAGEDRVDVSAQLKTSEPLPARESSLFYVTEGGLSRRNPNQGELPGLTTLEGGR